METTQLIKDKLDIVEFIKGYVPLTPAGKNQKGLCPFHKEKTPSFMVSPDRQMWHCFGCNSGGSIFDFVMKYENIEFFEALKMLAEKAGIETSYLKQHDQREFTVIYEITDVAKKFFQESLRAQDPSADGARKYLSERGLRQETIEEFEIGFAPNVSDALSRYLTQKGYRIADIEKAGLVFRTERGTYWDRFRNRIMFPLFNQFGKPVGFTGRILPGGESDKVGKYVNSPETSIFNKSRVLYGFDKSKSHIRDKEEAVFVEGQMDLIMSWQDGVKNIVATSGTALTLDHLKILHRVCEKLILSFDNDDAGQLAIERSIDLAQGADFSVFVAALGEFKDPADVAQKKAGALQKFFADAVPAMQYYFDRYLKPTKDISLEKKNVRVLLGKIKVLQSEVEKSHWILELSHRVRADERALRDEMSILNSRGLTKSVEPSEEAFNGKPFPRKEIILQRMLGILFSDQSLYSSVGDIAELFPKEYQELYSVMKEGRLKEIGESSPLNTLANIVALRSGLAALASSEDVAQEFKNLLREFLREHYREELKAREMDVREAEKLGDETALSKALREFDIISKKMHNT